MRKKDVMILGFCIALLLIVNVSALYTQDDNQVSFGHPLRVQNISVPDLAPGETGILKINMKNSAEYSISDVRAKITLPPQLQLLNDVNEVRVSEIKSNQIREVEYRIIALPTTSEGIYSATLMINYISHFGVNAFNVGEDNSDNYSFGIIVKSPPSLFVQMDGIDVYKEKTTGDITLKFVNNGTSNIKFLTVNLEQSSDYEILSSDKNYVGDLDSNDFQSVVYTIKVNNKVSEVNLPVDITYRDAMNNFYSQKLNPTFKIMDGSEIGKAKDISISTIILIVVILGLVIYFIYSRFRKKKNKNYK
jgi:hypothetical protein